MKMLYYAMFDKPSDCENWIANAFVRADVLVHKWQRRLGSFNSSWKDVIDYCKFHKIDTFLFNKAPELTVADLQQLRQLNIKIFMWTFDWMQDPSIVNWFVPLAKAVDICFMTDGTDDNSYYLNKGIKRIELHQGFDSDVHFLDSSIRNEELIPNVDVVFLGSKYTQRREQLVNFLSKQCGSRFLHVGANNALDYGAWGKDFRRVIASAKIVVGDNYTNTVPGYWSDRIYLTLACGGFFMPSYVKGLEREFVDKQDVVWWNDFGQLYANIEYYLHTEEGRLKAEEIATNGYNQVIARHSYDDRINYFLDCVKNYSK